MARDLFLVANGLLLVWLVLDFLLLWWGNIRRHRRGEQPRPARSLLDWVKILATGIAIAAINTYSRSIVEILRSPQARSIAIASLIAFSLLFTIAPILFVIKVSREERHRKMAASSVKARFGASTHTEPLEVESRSAQS
jgi:hypothetical protein